MPSRAMDTPVGRLTLTETAGSLVALRWTDGPERSDSPLLDEAVRQLQAYFAGTLQRFDLPLSPAGSPFQQSVWREMSRIPFGRTMSYGALAGRIGGIARAVGTACGENPIPVIIPCHRVGAAGKALGGFSGGEGAATKRLLLAHEIRHAMRV